MVSLPLRTCLEKLPPDALPCDTRQLARESHLLVLPVFGAVTRNSFGENGDSSGRWCLFVLGIYLIVCQYYAKLLR